MNYEQIEAVASVFRDAPTLTEIEMRSGDGGVSLRLRRPAPRPKAAPAPMPKATSKGGGTSAAAAAAAEAPGALVTTSVTELVTVKAAAEIVAVTAGFVGVFHMPSGGPVAAGDTVKAGQVIGRIEAIRLLNDCTAPAGGLVRYVAVHEGQPVEYGQLLFEIEPEEAP